MNVFDDSTLINNNPVSVTTSNSFTNLNNSLSQNINSSNTPIQNTNSSTKQTINSNVNEEKVKLEKLKEVIKLLPDEDINLLNDMTNGNLEAPNIVIYIKMSRKEKLEFLANKQNDKSNTTIKHKVSLKKKR